MSPRYAARTDANHKEIVEALHGVGATTENTAALGQDRPDVIVGFRGRNYWLEIKNPAQRSKSGVPWKGRNQHEEWHARWNGHVETVWTIEEALRAIGALA